VNTITWAGSTAGDLGRCMSSITPVATTAAAPTARGAVTSVYLCLRATPCPDHPGPVGLLLFAPAPT
jgi:hypothetical protein